jgi:K+-transporting ATPase ATPase C chain
MREVLRSVLVLLILTLITGVVYPLAVWLVGQAAVPYRANGSLIKNRDQVIGSELIGQYFQSPRYFHGRPSAVDCDASGSGGSNLGPTNSLLVSQVEERIRQVRSDNGLAPDRPLPADLVLCSASGLDPDLSLEAALLQVPRIAHARQMNPESLAVIVRSKARMPSVITGSRALVNVLELNLFIDRRDGK